ncbi:tyrosine-type recombinase/integrase [Streptosporangium sp. NPDC002544]|uniref:tyrosine-type recombinase/integrase n=1 Tax=Streptosporangium sp. NPDC002544 TaxID=3154538 RepID=UPI003328FC0D
MADPTRHRSRPGRLMRIGQQSLEGAGVIPVRETGTRRWTESREEGFHALRHHFASVLLADGVDIRGLAEFLGHEDPGFTLRTYAHFMPSGEERMRKAVERALGGGTANGLSQET